MTPADLSQVPFGHARTRSGPVSVEFVAEQEGLGHGNVEACHASRTKRHFGSVSLRERRMRVYARSLKVPS